MSEHRWQPPRGYFADCAGWWPWCAGCDKLRSEHPDQNTTVPMLVDRK